MVASFAQTGNMDKKSLLTDLRCSALAFSEPMRFYSGEVLPNGLEKRWIERTTEGMANVNARDCKAKTLLLDVGR